MPTAYIGARNGVYRLEGEDFTLLGLERHRFWAIYSWRNEQSRDTILAGSYGSGMFRSDDSGATWEPANEGLSIEHFRTIQPDPTDPSAIVCGGEPGRGFRSWDGGRSWQEFAGITELPTCPEWFLPYSRRAGALRNFYSPPGSENELFASIEVGGLVYSPDGGDSWEMIGVDPGPRVHDDVHFIAGDPNDPDVLYAALGGALLDREQMQRPDEPRRIGGVARSDDGGRSWQKLLPDYTRAALVPPARQDLLLAAPAQRTNEGGRIEVSDDRGESWQDAADGVDIPMPDMVERFELAPDGDIWAVCSGGRLFHSTPGDEWRWIPAPTNDAGIIADSISFTAG